MGILREVLFDIAMILWPPASLSPQIRYSAFKFLWSYKTIDPEFRISLWISQHSRRFWYILDGLKPTWLPQHVINPMICENKYSAIGTSQWELVNWIFFEWKIRLLSVKESYNMVLNMVIYLHPGNFDFGAPNKNGGQFWEVRRWTELGETPSFSGE